MKRRSILISDSQSEWIEDNSINLSKYVRNKINEDISNDENKE